MSKWDFGVIQMLAKGKNRVFPSLKSFNTRLCVNIILETRFFCWVVEDHKTPSCGFALCTEQGAFQAKKKVDIFGFVLHPPANFGSRCQRNSACRYPPMLLQLKPIFSFDFPAVFVASQLISPRKTQRGGQTRSRC